MRTLIALLALVTQCFTMATTTEQLYRRLDALIANQDSITLAKQASIDAVRVAMTGGQLSPEAQYALNDRMYEQYIAFKFDSALHYATLNVELARTMNNARYSNAALLKLAYIQSVAGLFEVADNTLDHIDTRSLDDSLRAEYYNERAKLYLFRQEYTQGTPYEAANADSAQHYRALTIGLAAPGSYRRTFADAVYHCENGDYDTAIKMLQAELKKTIADSTGSDEQALLSVIDRRRYAVITSTLAYFYRRKGDERQCEHYLLLAAISDVAGAVRENTSLRSLSMMLLDKGDPDRAFNYLNTSINDAKFFGTRLRNIQSAQLVPIIIKAYNDNRTASHQRRAMLLILVGATAFILILALAYALYQNRKRRAASRQVSRINATLSETVEQLKDVNSRLAQTSNIEDEYLTRLLMLCSTLIDRNDHRRKDNLKLAHDRRYEQLVANLKSNSDTAESVTMFHDNFDEAFLNIYPDFVATVNSLLKSDAQVETDGKGLSTELRILALIRLGISDNATIAGILRASLSTVYTYRSRLKARALTPETFEAVIKQERGAYAPAEVPATPPR